jgi:hypothetical protein
MIDRRCRDEDQIGQPFRHEVVNIADQPGRNAEPNQSTPSPTFTFSDDPPRRLDRIGRRPEHWVQDIMRLFDHGGDELA